MSTEPRMKPIALGLACVALAGLPVVCWAASSMRPGQWEITVQTEMAGMPQKMPPVTASRCVTPEQARDPVNHMAEQLRRAEHGGEHCSVTHHTSTGTIVRWSIQCTGRQAVQSDGEITFESNAAYHGTVKNQIQTPQGSMLMTQTLKGRRLGDCAP